MVKPNHLPFLFICLLASACTRPDDPYESIYGKFDTSKWIHIELKDCKYKDITPDSYIILQDDEFASSSYFVIDMKDSLMAVADGFKTFKSIDLSTGQVMREYVFEGKGPGEYEFIVDLLSDFPYALIVDGPQFKVIRYNGALNQFDEFIIPGFNPLRQVDYRHPYFIYTATMEMDHTLSIRNLDDPEDLRSLHPLIIPKGKQPNGYNTTIPSVSPNGDMAVLSQMMPFLFMYRDVFGRDVTTPDIAIRFHREELIMVGKPTRLSMGGIENPPPVVMESYAGQTIGITPIFNDMVLDDHWVFINQQPENRLLVLRRDGDRFTHHGSYRFLDADGAEVNYRDITYSYPWIYLGSAKGILKVNVGELE